MAQFTVPLPRFDGHGSYRRFRSDFKSFCTIQKFTDDEALNCLPLCLHGVAREAFDGLERPAAGSESGSKPPLEPLLDRLGEVFPDATSMDSHSTLQSLRFNPDAQSLDIFTVQLRGLVTAVFGAPTPDSHLFHYFLAAMPQRLAHAVVAGGCLTYDSAVDRVRNVLAADRLPSGPVRPGGPGESVYAVTGAQPDAVTGARPEAVTGARPESELPHVVPESGAEGPGVRSVGSAGSAVVSDPAMLELILRRIEQLELQVAQDNAQRVGTGREGREAPRSAHNAQRCLCCGEPGHTKGECRLRMARCFRCGKTGHIQRMCFPGNADGEGAGRGGRAPPTFRRGEPRF